MKVTSPTSLADACRALANDPALVPIAGATDVLVHWPVRTAEHDKSYLNLLRIGELRHMTWAGDSLTLGALATYWDAIQDKQVAQEFPLLIDAARQVGAIQIQSRGTWAGNIANGSPAADGVPVLMAYDAEVVLASSSATRRVPLASYYAGHRRSVRRPESRRPIGSPRWCQEVARRRRSGGPSAPRCWQQPASPPSRRALGRAG